MKWNKLFSFRLILLVRVVHLRPILLENKFTRNSSQFLLCRGKIFPTIMNCLAKNAENFWFFMPFYGIEKEQYIEVSPKWHSLRSERGNVNLEPQCLALWVLNWIALFIPAGRRTWPGSRMGEKLWEQWSSASHDDHVLCMDLHVCSDYGGDNLLYCLPLHISWISRKLDLLHRPSQCWFWIADEECIKYRCHCVDCGSFWNLLLLCSSFT